MSRAKFKLFISNVIFVTAKYSLYAATVLLIYNLQKNNESKNCVF
jgi:hypothetical protein